MAIRSQLLDYATSREGGDGQAQAAFFTEDAETWLASTGSYSRGRSELARELTVPPDPNRRFRLEVEQVAFFAADVAFVDARSYGAGSAPTNHAFYVMVKRNGIWLRATALADRVRGCVRTLGLYGRVRCSSTSRTLS